MLAQSRYKGRINMNQIPINSLYTIANGITPSTPFVEVFMDRDPTPNDTQYPIQKRWFNTTTDAEWILIGFTSAGGLLQAEWVDLSSGSGAVLSITTPSGDIFPDPGTHEITFTSNGSVSITGTGSTVNFTTSTGASPVEFVQGNDGLEVGPNANIITFLGSAVPNGTNPLSPVWFKEGATLLGTEDLNIQVSEAAASANINNAGLSSFSSNQFTVDPATGFVQLSGSTGPAVQSITVGTTSVTPNSTTGEITFTSVGGSVIFTPSTNTIDFATSGSGTGTLQTLSDTSGFMVTPLAQNIQIRGEIVEQSPNPVFSTVQAFGANNHQLTINPMSSARWIVDPLSLVSGIQFNGTHATLQAAIAVAQSGDTIFMMPGTYTFTTPLALVAGVNIVAWTADALTPNVIINGPLSASFSGTATLSGLFLQTNSITCLSVGGSNATIVNLKNCYINALNNTAIGFTSSSTSAVINFFQCQGNIATTGISLFSSVSNGTLNFWHCNFANTGGSTTANLISSGLLTLFGCFFNNAITCESPANFTITLSSIFQTGGVTALTAGGSASTLDRTSLFSSVSALTITGVLAVALLIVDGAGTYAITGTGGLVNDGGISFSGFTFLVNPTLTVLGGAIQGLTNGASPTSGYLGQQIRGYNGSGTALTTATIASIISISLTAGVWDISALGQCNFGGTSTQFMIAISTSGTSFVPNNGSDNVATAATSTAINISSLSIPAYRVTISATTTYHLVAQATFSTSTATGFGRISATRVG
jgi:hypothetical protein